MKSGKRKIPDFLVREEEPNGKLKSILSIIAHYKTSELSICSYDKCFNEKLSIEYQDKYIKNEIYDGQK